MNEVSIILNGVRYDAVEQYEFTGCYGCDLFNMFSRNCGHCICTALDGSVDMHKMIFKKSDKKFEKMTAKDFFNLVSEMRQNQKDYFKTRPAESLRKSKELEKKVDDEIERAKKIISDKQMNLFNHE